MTLNEPETFPKGALVRLKAHVAEGDRNTAKIEACCDRDIAEGARKLDRALNGFRYWNIEDLDLADEPHREKW